MAAGLSKIFRPAAPSTIRKGPSKVRALKSGKAGANRAEESMSDSSSVQVVRNASDISSSDAGGQKAAPQGPYKQDGEVIPTDFRYDIAGTYKGGEGAGPSQQKQQEQGANSNGASSTEWSQLPGSIPDPEEKADSAVKQKTPPTPQGNDSKPKPIAMDGKAINPEDIESIPQPSKTFVRDVRARRVMKEFRAVSKLCSRPSSIFSVELEGDNLFEWNIKLFEVDPLSLLHYDMEKRDIPYILFNLSFPDNFPFNPPFVRVVSPRIENGYVMDGGAICMELLTPGGWSSAYTIEAVVMQLGATLVAGHARLSKGKRYRIFGDVAFNKQEAMDSFRNIVETHKKYGWHSPAGEFS